MTLTLTLSRSFVVTVRPARARFLVLFTVSAWEDGRFGLWSATDLSPGMNLCEVDIHWLHAVTTVGRPTQLATCIRLVQTGWTVHGLMIRSPTPFRQGS